MMPCPCSSGLAARVLGFVFALDEEGRATCGPVDMLGEVHEPGLASVDHLDELADIVQATNRIVTSHGRKQIEREPFTQHDGRALEQAPSRSIRAVTRPSIDSARSDRPDSQSLNNRAPRASGQPAPRSGIRSAPSQTDPAPGSYR